MTLSYNSASPAGTQTGWLGTSPGIWTSPSFSPQAASAIIVTAYCDLGYIDTLTVAIQDSLSSHLSWHRAAFETDPASPSNYTAGVVVYWSYVAAAPGAMTVTVTFTAASQYVNSVAGKIDLWSGANSSLPIGTVVKGSSPVQQTLSVNVTPQAAGSALALAVVESTYAGAMSPQSNFSFNTGGNGLECAEEWYGTGNQGKPVLTANTSTQTLTITGATTSTQFQYVAYEILAGSGTSNPTSATAQLTTPVTLTIPSVGTGTETTQISSGGGGGGGGGATPNFSGGLLSFF